jgi:hypothetical protein
MLNQTQFGTPAGAGVSLSPVTDKINDFFQDRKNRMERSEGMAAQHALTSIRDSRRFEHESSMEGSRQAHESALQSSRQSHEEGLATRQLAAKIYEGQESRKHESRMARSTQRHEASESSASRAHELARMGAAFEGIKGLGKSGRTAEFQVGDVKAKFNPKEPRQPRATTAAAPTRNPEQPTVVPPSSGFVPKVRQNSTTGKIERIPVGEQAPVSTPAAKKTTSKAARRPRSK